VRLSTQASLRAPAEGGFGAVADRIRDLERAGLDQVWVGEAYGFDGPTALGFLAGRTERVELGAGILPIYTRTPTLIAQTAAGLDAISGGRAVLGLGSSGPQVIEGFHGVPYDRPLQRTREIIEICRKVWRREVVEHHGANYALPLPAEQGTGLGKALKLMTHPVRSAIPIYLASLAPRSVELAAELADGWLPLFFLPEKASSVWGEALRRGAARRAPELAPLEVVAGGLVAIGDGLESLRDLERPHLALYVGGMGARGRNFYNDLARRLGYEAEAKAIQDAYLDGRKAEAEALVPAELVERTSLIGPESYVAERIAAYREAGVTTLNVTPLAPTLEARIRLIEQVRALAD
jgi:F420-dependent oxidoreductase-like protein